MPLYRWLPLLLLVGCGDGGGGDGMDAGNAGDDLGGGGAGDLASGGGGGGSARLYPIGVGNQWTYVVTQVGAGSVCAPGTHMQQVSSANPVGGRAAFQMNSFCSGIAGTNDYSNPSGDEVDFYYNGAWATLVDPTLAEGHNWSYFNASYTWHRESSVTVPAGTFTDCWTANQQVSYTAYLTYCRGAGLVRSYSQDLAGSGWDAQLSAKNF